MQAVIRLGHVPSPVEWTWSCSTEILLEALKLHPLRSGFGQFLVS
jgi:hypothetical protein